MTSRKSEPREVPLSRGMVALVDEENYDLVMLHGPWFAKPDYRNFYAIANLPRRPDGTKPPQMRMHALIMGQLDVDHMDGNGLNNQKENLRPSNGQNQQNRRIQTNNTSGVPGVVRHRGEKWHVQVYFHGKAHHGGSYLDLEEARIRRNELAKELHGEFAKVY